MCGLVAVVNQQPVLAIRDMNGVQAHRGPDDHGIWETTMDDGRWVGLGSRRLAILDLSPAGHMPMSTADNRYTIAYNGEIYNYPALKKELEAKGYVFHSGSDTEAILYLYQEYGPECVRRLNGMFAIAIWDNPQQRLFLARDHFGIKPLYYTQQGVNLAVASEIKSFLQLPGFTRNINYTALHQYLTFLWVPDPLTLFDGVYKLPAGHWAIYEQNELKIQPFWDLTFPPADHFVGQQIDEAALATELRERFIATVKSQMISDVPLGAFLSAGLDSSSIVAAMAQISSQPVRTFTIAFPPHHLQGEVHIDDLGVAARTAAAFGCQHTDIIVEPNVTDLLPHLIWHMDEPTADPAIIAAYLVNREARRDVTVLLSGIGGDELFAGYRKYRGHFLAERYRRIPRLLRTGVIEPMTAALPAFRGTPIKGYVRLAKKMTRSGSLPPHDRFITDSVYLDQRQKRELYTAVTGQQVGQSDSWERHNDYFTRVADADFLNQMLYLDSKAFMTSLNLTYNDKMSMASSVEVRVPFLDWEFAEWAAWSVPPQLKMNQKASKHILREAMRPLLPPEVLTQRKAGFAAPVDYWLAQDLRPMVDDLLSEETIRRRGLFEPHIIRRYIDEQRQGREDWSLQLWQFLTLELWMQAFLDV